jgi:sugar-specific transcriptional regulator TrmB
MILDFLKKIGLTSGEIKVYSAVLEIGISSLNSIHEKTGIERRNIYDILNKLIEKGLVSYTIEKGKKKFQITHPNKIISYLEDKKQEILKTEKEIKPNIKELLDQFNKSKSTIRAEVFRGNEAIKSLHEESLNYKEQFWIGGNSGVESTSIKTWFSHWMKKRAEKKIWMYDLVDHGTYLEGLEPHKIKEHKKMFYKYCELPKDLSSPMVIFIFGNKVAQILWSDQPFAFVLESEEIKNSFMKYFYFFWK